jgi:Mg2+ and Co2+ transporter CorA
MAPPGVRRLTLWKQHQRPCGFDPTSGRTDGAVLWIELDKHADPIEARRWLSEACAVQLPDEAVGDLLQPDLLPEIKAHGDVVRAVSTVRVRVSDTDRAILFEPLEIAVGDGWIVTCDHGRSEDFVEPGVQDLWVREELRTSGELGVAVLHQLMLSAVHARRTLTEWLDDWEIEGIGGDRGSTADLRQLRSYIAHFHKHLNRLNVPQTEAHNAWFPSVHNREIAQRVDRLIDRSLRDLRELGEVLRLTLEEIQLQKTEAMERRLALITALVLFPTLVAGVFGANTQVPGHDHWSGFYIMLAIMGVGAVVAFVLVMLRKPVRSRRTTIFGRSCGR